ncbi:hypothetical protein HYH03_008963 [Edaphochlamys debaryana]|uniref:BTB domain-containing protein n=1 Tax=Edaphochlamys debaryana TaxID=47281 RepID=A0A835Y188_9CHLO|nr:hypothetical protein HYH03_008963 [Edaphochlamys debaryana]|eukprot:KAG2492803.1 hypothetical protein HYH03_008963 [Edaphochlamys debaryana]
MLALFEGPANSTVPGGAAVAERKAYDLKGVRCLLAPVYDSFSNSVFLVESSELGTSPAIMRLAPDNTMTLVAGSRTQTGYSDGPGSRATFRDVQFLTTDNAGCLYLAAPLRPAPAPGRRHRKPAAVAAGAAAGAAAVAERGAGGRGAAAAAATDAPEAVVSTLNLPDARLGITGLAYVPGGPSPESSQARGGCLVYSSLTCIWRVPIEPGPAGAVGARVVLAGDDDNGSGALVDGVGASASFRCISGMVAEASGSVVVVDDNTVRRVALDGSVSSLVEEIQGNRVLPYILPGGQLALCCADGTDLDLLDLGLDPVPLCPPAPVPPGPAPGSLAADLSALLEPGQGQAEGEASTSDLKLRVGGRVFPVHRAILSARCPCFRRRLGGGFADAGAAELDLPDADPEAMEALLRWMYTGCLPPELPSPLLQPLAELSDRLGLMQPCRAAQGRILEAVCAQSVVGALLWAEQRGDGFAELLAGLKDWYLEHTEEVVDTARDTLQRLAAESPALSVELQVAWIKRPRTK